MNIALVSDVYLPTVSGVAASTDSIARFMAAQGHHVTLLCPRPLAPHIVEQASGLDIIHTPGVSDSLFVNKSMTPFPLGIPIVWRLFRDAHIDVVHIQEPGSLGVSALLLAKLFRIPTVGAQHFSWAQVERVAPPFLRWVSVPFMKGYVFLIYKTFDAIMVPTKTSARALSALIGNKKRIYPISNGVDTRMYVPKSGASSPLRAKYSIPKRMPVFLYVGRLDADKNIETIIQALARVKVPMHCCIAGVGRRVEELQTLARTLNVGNLTWIGEVKPQALLDLYHLADGFVIMSPVETQSIVALQALACGLPLIAANAGALPELVDGTNGYLVDTYDVDMLTRVLEKLATDTSLRRSMGKRGRTLSLLHHKPTVLKRLEAVYKEVGAQRV